MKCVYRHPPMFVITDGGAIILQRIRFQCAAVWISTGDPFIYYILTYTYLTMCVPRSESRKFRLGAAPSGVYLLRKSGSVCVRLAHDGL